MVEKDLSLLCKNTQHKAIWLDVPLMAKNVTLSIEEKQAFPQAKMLGKPTFFFFFFVCETTTHCFVVNMSYSRVKVFNLACSIIDHLSVKGVPTHSLTLQRE